MGSCGAKPARIDRASPQRKRGAHKRNLTRSEVSVLREGAEPFEEPLEIVREEHKEFEKLSIVSKFSEEILQALFEIFTDVGKINVRSGKFGHDEFAKALKLNPSSLLCQALFSTFDATKLAQLTFREFVMALSALSPQADKQDKLSFSFNMFDVNNNGEIKLEELHRLLTSAVLESKDSVLQGVLTADDIDEICHHTIAQNDVKLTGGLDRDEFTLMIEKNPSVLQAFTIDVDALANARREGALREKEEEEDGRKVIKSFVYENMQLSRRRTVGRLDALAKTVEVHELDAILLTPEQRAQSVSGNASAGSTRGMSPLSLTDRMSPCRLSRGPSPVTPNALTLPGMAWSS